MITLKSPMVFGSLSAMEICSDRLAGKILGNYSLIGANITAEDLLHMTTQPPEVFVNVENFGSILNDNSFNVDNSVKLELMNQLFNRISLYGSDEFTYQDEVFVSSMLQKLGITNLWEFMQQVKLNREHNERIQTLINKYFEINNSNKKLVDIEASKTENKNVSQISINNNYDTDLYIQNEIFRRLNTAQYINTVYDYNNMNTAETKPANIADITLIEQADRIQLTRLKEKLLSQSAPDIWNSYFRYEAKSLEINEYTKENITKRISAAVLENIIDKISYMPFTSYAENMWMDYIPVMYKSSEDVIERFKYYQSEYEAVNIEEINSYNDIMDRLVSDEIRLADLLLLTDNYEINEENENYVTKNRQSILISMLENQNIQKQAYEKLKLLAREKTNNIFTKSMYEDEKLGFIKNISESRSFYSSLRNDIKGDIEVYDIENTPENRIYEKLKFWEGEKSGSIFAQSVYEGEKLEFVKNINESESYYSSLRNDIKGDITVYNIEKLPENKTYEKLKLLEEKKADNILVQSIYGDKKPEFIKNINENESYYSSLKNDRQGDIKVYDIENMPENRTDKEAVPENVSDIIMENISEIIGDENVEINIGANIQDDFITSLINKYESNAYGVTKPYYENVEFLEELNNHNIYMKKLLDSTKPVKPAQAKHIVVDRKKAMKDALKALDNPESIRQEVLENGVAIERELPGEIERILSITDSSTRKFYESLIGSIYNIDSLKIKSNSVRQDNHESLTESIYNIDSPEIKNNTIRQDNNIEAIINSIKNETDVKNAITDINNIITDLQNDTTLDAHNTNEYITYLQSINNELDNLNEYNIQKDKENTFEKELEHSLIRINEKVREYYEKHTEYINGKSGKNYMDKGKYPKAAAVTQKNNITTAQNIEAIINTIENQTDIKNAVSKINDIINTVNNDLTITDIQKSIYVTNLQDIITHIEKSDILALTDSINKISVAGDYSIKQQFIVDHELKQQIDNILLKVNNTAQGFYDELNYSEITDTDRYFTIDGEIYNDSDIINKNSGISIKNVSEILESINNEADINNAVTQINEIILKLNKVNAIKDGDNINNEDNGTYIIKKITAYKEHLTEIVNELENTKVINQVITQNNNLVEKYIHKEVDRILRLADKYEESVYEEENRINNIRINNVMENGKNTNESHATQSLADNRELVNDSIDMLVLPKNTKNPYEAEIDLFTNRSNKVKLIHTSKETIQDEIIDEIRENVKHDTDKRINIYEETTENQVTQKQLQDMKKELIRQSEESITRIVDQNIHTQVHAISDMVYLELEKRLRNEQRRRGY